MRRDLMAGVVLALATTTLTAMVAGDAHAAGFDARRAADVAAVITAHGASGALKKGDDAKAYFDGQVGNTVFEAHFQNCDGPRTYCTTILLSGSWDSKKITIDQINRWNRWTLFCPAYIDGDGAPNVWYSISVSDSMVQGDLNGDVGTWMDCLHDFDSFVGAPEDFLKNHS
jgi:hypothetical protein